MAEVENSLDLPKGFSIYSWNINGIRTLNMSEVISNLKCDILAVQETKISRDQLDEATAHIDGGSSFFSFSTRRAGYSGVATYCHKNSTPVKAEDGLSGLLPNPASKDDRISSYYDTLELSESERPLAKQCDSEGRAVVTQYTVKVPNRDDKIQLLTVINVYCPRLRDDPADTVNNEETKYLFHHLISVRAQELVRSGSFVLIVGDLNVSHNAIDVAEGGDTMPRNRFHRWLDDLLLPGLLGFHDTFRRLHSTQENAFTCWTSRTNARQNNYGSRIDYILADSQLINFLDDAQIHPEITGSDHCPVSATFHSLVIQNSTKHPPLSTKWYPEFSGKQKSLKDFFSRQTAPSFNKPQSSPVLNSVKKTAQFKKGQLKPKKRTSTSITKEKQLNLAHFIIKKPKAEADPTNVDDQGSSECGATQIQRTTESEFCQDIKIELEQGSFVEGPSTISSNTNSALVEYEYEVNKSKTTAALAWKQLMKAPEVPHCAGHKEPCTLRLTKKKGPNLGRKFWSCSRGDGKVTDPNANCGHFQWVVNSKP